MIVSTYKRTWAEESFECAVSVSSKFQETKRLGNNPIQKTWEPPPLGVYKLNVDGTLFFDTQKVGIRFIVRDHIGKVKLVANIAKKDVDNHAVIEVLLALRSFQLCMNNDFTNIILKSICLLLVEEVLSPFASCSNLENIVMNITNLTDYFTSCYIQYARRDCNRVTHKLARNAWHTDEIVLWMGEISHFLEHSVWMDSSHR